MRVTCVTCVNCTYNKETSTNIKFFTIEVALKGKNLPLPKYGLLLKERIYPSKIWASLRGKNLSLPKYGLLSKERICSLPYFGSNTTKIFFHDFYWLWLKNLGPVVQSVVSLTSSLRVISLTVLADSIYSILIFFAEKMWVAFNIFSAKISFSSADSRRAVVSFWRKNVLNTG